MALRSPEHVPGHALLPAVVVRGRPEPIAVRTIYGIGRNYREHAKELGNEVPSEPVVFLKAPASLRSLESGNLAFPDETFHFEAELVLLIEPSQSAVGPSGWEVVAGLALGLDLTRREVQTRLKAKGLPWTGAKSFTGSAVVGPIVPIAEFGGPEALANLGFRFTLNGELRQVGYIKDMIFSVPSLLKHLASYNQLLPGDLVFTGTPAGVGGCQVGDTFTLEFLTGERVIDFNGRL